MNLRATPVKFLREKGHARKNKSENNFRCITEDNDSFMQKENIKIKTIIMCPPYLERARIKTPERYSNFTHQRKSLGDTQTSFSRAGAAEPFYLPRKNAVTPARKIREAPHDWLKSREKESNQSHMMPTMLNSKQKHQISQFLSNDVLSLTVKKEKENRKKSEQGPGFNGVVTHSSKASYVKRRLSMGLMMNDPSIYTKGKQSSKPETLSDKINRLKTFDLFQKIASSNHKFLEIQGPQTRLNSQAQDEDIKDPRYPCATGISPPESTLQTRVHTEEPVLENSNKYYSERIIIENKNKLLVCVDNDNPNEPLKYCFVAKTGGGNQRRRIKNLNDELDRELNARIDELQKTLSLNAEYKFLFLLDGTEISKIQDVPQQESIIIISRKRNFISGERIMQNDLARNFYYYKKRINLVRFNKAKSINRISIPKGSSKSIEKNINDRLEGFCTEDLDSDLTIRFRLTNEIREK